MRRQTLAEPDPHTLQRAVYGRDADVEQVGRSAGSEPLEKKERVELDYVSGTATGTTQQTQSPSLLPREIALFIDHGADLTIRNNKGKTVMEASKEKGPLRQEALRKAIQRSNERN